MSGVQYVMSGKAFGTFYRDFEEFKAQSKSYVHLKRRFNWTISLLYFPLNEEKAAKLQNLYSRH